MKKVQRNSRWTRVGLVLGSAGSLGRLFLKHLQQQAGLSVAELLSAGL